VLKIFPMALAGKKIATHVAARELAGEPDQQPEI
jgi:hypothetical protein